jgi:hypothetical protein
MKDKMLKLISNYRDKLVNLGFPKIWLTTAKHGGKIKLYNEAKIFL